jgi:hypothetical protein
MLDTYNIKKCNQHLLEEKMQHQRFGTKSIIEKKKATPKISDHKRLAVTIE